jgi:hypothetical protein
VASPNQNHDAITLLREGLTETFALVDHATMPVFDQTFFQKVCAQAFF